MKRIDVGAKEKTERRTVDRTGVELEALSAVSAACLTVYDMLKRHERVLRIGAVKLVEKKGGRSVRWRRSRRRAAPGRKDPAAEPHLDVSRPTRARCR